MKTKRYLPLLAAFVLLPACGGIEKRMEKEEIKRNAEDAAAELDRESAKHQDRN